MSGSTIAPNATRRTKKHFDRSLLPPASAFYKKEFSRLSRMDRQGWVRANCPWHESKSKQSLAVNLSHGGFYCHGCGKKGGDLVEYQMQRHGLSFRAACESLGAWRGLTDAEQARIEQENRDREKRRQLELEAAEDAQQELIRVRDFLHTLEQIQRDAAAELAARHADNPSEDTPQQQKLWHVLAVLQDLIRDADSTYRELAGLEAAA